MEGMSSIAGTNRLDETHSPYLLQHADNPVHWQAWDADARTLAAERDVPLFISIGYAACHWCHVMEEESFSDESIAGIVNERFVPIKIDREERPAVDRLYQTVSQLVTGSGGWPLSVWATPDGRPFYIGTYFPPKPARGRPGFPTICEQVATSWEEDRDAIEERADEWIAAAESQLTPSEQTAQPSGDPGERILTAAQAASRGADRIHGGFGESGPKFPQSRRIELLLQAAVLDDRSRYAEIVTEALDAMADRGLYDHIGGGFHRYATDRSWQIPHFEKMLYDNAELARLYLYGAQVTGDDRYLSVATETLDFVTRELQNPIGGAYSSLDAQSEGREGTFYVWTPAQINSALGDRDAALFCERFGVTSDGNFENGTSVLRIVRSIDDIAEEYGMAESAVRERLERAKTHIREIREDRERPRRDEKVLAGWNGLLISAYSEAALIADPVYADRAQATLDFIRSSLWDGADNLLYRRYLDGHVGVPGYLDDYAFLARGALDCYQATGNREALEFALDLGRAIRDRFWDADAGILAYEESSETTLLANQQDLTDQSIPSSAGIAIDVLSTLESIAPNDEFETIIETYIEQIDTALDAAPTQHATLTMATHRAATRGVELTLVDEQLTSPWTELLRRTYIPNRFLTRRPQSEAEIDAWCDHLELETVPPVWRDRKESDALYICHSMTCSPPLTTPAEAATWLDQFGIST